MNNIFSLLLFLLLLPSCSSFAPRSSAPNSNTSIVADLKPVVREAILQTSPHYKNLGGSLEAASDTAFTGNYDWHSAVHAHWALLSMARWSKDHENETFVLNRLPPEVLQKEQLYLRENPDFEMPYGRVWLLQLLVEMKKHSEVANDAAWTQAVRDLQKDMEKSVLNWLIHTPFPDGKNNPRYYPATQKFRGDHYSWLFGYLFLKLSAEKNADIQSHLRVLDRDRIQPEVFNLMKTSHIDFDFLEIPALIALTELLDERSSSYLCDRAELPNNFARATAHRAGAYIMDAWPCAMRSRTDAKAKEIFDKHLQNLMSRPDQWRNDFANVGHWVPQFIWMGMWLDLGRP